jgi:hypothetical protein
MQGAVFHRHAKHTNAFAIDHQQIQAKVLDEEVRVVLTTVSNHTTSTKHNHHPLPSNSAHKAYAT